MAKKWTPVAGLVSKDVAAVIGLTKAEINVTVSALQYALHSGRPVCEAAIGSFPYRIDAAKSAKDKLIKELVTLARLDAR